MFRDLLKLGNVWFKVIILADYGLNNSWWILFIIITYMDIKENESHSFILFLYFQVWYDLEFKV